MKLLFGLIFLATFALSQGQLRNKEWWETSVFYQIYPRSYKDSDGDGVGDIKGIIEKLPHLKAAGVGATWLSPIFSSPMVDFGYDISDFKNIDPSFGTMADFEELLAKAKELDIKVILDFVPNHTSNKHDWFTKSENREIGYEDYYIWHNGKENPEGAHLRNVPPNNWVAVFRGKAWEWSDKRNQYYYHQFAVEQPDLNYRNPKVVEEMKETLRFWLDKGADGFRVDAINHLMEVEDLRDEPRNLNNNDELSFGYVLHHYTIDLQDTYDKVYEFREVLDDWQKEHGGETRVLLTEAYTNITRQMLYFESPDKTKQGSHMPFNFYLVNDFKKDTTATALKNRIDEIIMNLPPGKITNWVTGNHDQPRVGSRFGEELVGAMTTLAMTLPGVAVTYYGEEIGMLDNRDISWEDTLDPQACNTNPDDYVWASRDPQRTSMQWDNTKNGGFSSADVTWLPVHPSYLTNNLQMQEATTKSVFKHYQALVEIRKHNTFIHGEFESKAISDKVFAFKRTLTGHDSFYVVINFGPDRTAVSLNSFDDFFSHDLWTEVAVGDTFYKGLRLGTNFIISGHDALVLRNRFEAEETTSIKVETTTDGSAAISAGVLLLIVACILQALRFL